jgi:hypothetical protein
MTTFDDASWHSGADDFPDDVPEQNAATHIGLFLTWAIDKGLFADPEVPREAVDAVRLRAMGGRELLLDYCDGKLFSGLLTEQGADFAKTSYDGFLEDFRRLLCQGLTSDYRVEDSAANHQIMAAALDERWRAISSSALRHRADKDRL